MKGKTQSIQHQAYNWKWHPLGSYPPSHAQLLQSHQLKSIYTHLQPAPKSSTSFDIHLVHEILIYSREEEKYSMQINIQLKRSFGII